ncbi:MAG TPA: hypothetical protein VF174_01525 [Micromonosporaceae bacterium]
MAQADDPSPLDQSTRPLRRSAAAADDAPDPGPDPDGSTGDATRKMPTGDVAPTRVATPRWTGLASPPAENKRRLPDGGTRPPLDPTRKLPAAERVPPEELPPVDPWADQPTADPVLPPTLPYPAPPIQPAPPPAAPAVPPPHHTSPTPAVAAPPPVAPPPVAPAWPPPGGQPPSGTIRVRRRRRWPWIMLTMTLVTVACCCGLPVYYGKPIFDQYPATAALPAQIGDLRLRDDPGGKEAAKRLERQMRAAHLIAEDTFAGIYVTPQGKQVTIFGVTGFRLDPATAVDHEITRLTPEYELGPARVFDTGRRGEHVSCATGRADGTGVVACAWADHGSLGTALFTRLSVEDSAVLLEKLRSAILTRD